MLFCVTIVTPSAACSLVATEHVLQIRTFSLQTHSCAPTCTLQPTAKPGMSRAVPCASRTLRLDTALLTRALLGLWIFHRLLGGGGGGSAFERPPMISAPGRRREKRKAAFESSRKIISKSFRSFFGSGQNWGLQGSKFKKFPKRFFDNETLNFKDRATNLIPLCLSH